MEKEQSTSRKAKSPEQTSLIIKIYITPKMRAQLFKKAKSLPKKTRNIKKDKLDRMMQLHFTNYTENLLLKREFLISQNNRYIGTFSIQKKKKKKTINLTQQPIPGELLTSAAFTQNFYCYPIEENIMSDPNLILSYYEDFTGIRSFDDIKDQILKELKSNYHFYPTQLDEQKSIENKMFFIWAFIKALEYLKRKNQFKILDFDKYIGLIAQFCKVSHKEYHYFYRVISEYTNSIQHWLKLRKEKASNICQYRRAYCAICNMYLCRLHFYNHKIEIRYKGALYMKPDFCKLSGNRNSIIWNPHSALINRKDNIKKCDNEQSLCRCNMHNQKQNQKTKKESFEIIKTMKKSHFYILLCFLSSKVTKQSCFMRRLFNNKYKCYILDQIIELCRDKKNQAMIKNYLGLKKKLDKKIPLPSNAIILNSIEFEKDVHINVDTRFLPCDHIGECTIGNCSCKKLTHRYCEKYCPCYEQGCKLAFQGCKLAFQGCKLAFQGCKCANGCIIGHCKCIKKGRECDPEICEKGCCSKTDIFKKIFKKTVVSQSTFLTSAGLFAYEDIKKGELIGEYLGELVTGPESLRRTPMVKLFERHYTFKFDSMFDNDAIRVGNSMRYINHGSCGAENCNASYVFVRGNYRIVIFAKKKIKKGTELLFDYGMKELEWITEYNKTSGGKSSKK